MHGVVRRSLGVAGVLLLGWGAPAAAGSDAAPLSLSCRGTLDAVAVREARLTSSLDAGVTADRAGAATLRPTRTLGRMTVVVQDGAVKMRPSAPLRPGANGKRSADGWYTLSDAQVSDARIAGVAPYRDDLGRRLTLVVDRRSGEVRFGGFAGGCEDVARAG